jgi:hypothetical protein
MRERAIRMRGRVGSRFLREAGLFHEQPDTAEQNEPTEQPAKHLGIESPDHPVAQPGTNNYERQPMAINVMLERS